jgi:hypothetical protein
MRWAGHAVHMWGKRAVYRVLSGNHEGRPFGRLRSRWECNVLCNKGMEVHNEEPNDLYYSRSIEKNEVCWALSCMAERRGVYGILI